MNGAVLASGHANKQLRGPKSLMRKQLHPVAQQIQFDLGGGINADKTLKRVVVALLEAERNRNRNCKTLLQNPTIEEDAVASDEAETSVASNLPAAKLANGRNLKRPSETNKGTFAKTSFCAILSHSIAEEDAAQANCTLPEFIATHSQPTRGYHFQGPQTSHGYPKGVAKLCQKTCWRSGSSLAISLGTALLVHTDEDPFPQCTEFRVRQFRL